MIQNYDIFKFDASKNRHSRFINGNTDIEIFIDGSHKILGNLCLD